MGWRISTGFRTCCSSRRGSSGGGRGWLRSYGSRRISLRADIAGAALQPIRGTSPLPQELCKLQDQGDIRGSGLVPRMGRKAAPDTQASGQNARIPATPWAPAFQAFSRSPGPTPPSR
ncbi:hypothetical protein E6B08_05465 [Pseudomonas putida]|uniref:Uncharacterized protein n=1 Tax=Pseudomonas putida TaxID=303 RepID=A0A4D6X4E9_PSEPU|nr:hypothetical protein E6B08_05465 [Pseudomonas putida]